jgi:adenosylmethionine-8-amino-7-oxononanoate aminotransferase
LNLLPIDKKYVWHPFTQMQEWSHSNSPVIVRGKGFYLIDEHGNKFLDGIASMWCNVWGHGDNEISKAMIKQIQTIPHSTLFGLANAPSTQLSEMLIQLAKGMGHVFFSDNGSTAIEIAVKMALQYWKNKGKKRKTKFISMENGYHGDTIGAMSLGYLPRYFAPYLPLLRRAIKIPCPVSKFSQDDSHDYENRCLERTEAILAKNSSDLCALVMESGAQIAGGVSIFPKNYQKKIGELCRKYDVLLILDEIATGFGRLGNMLEYVEQNTHPDIVCLGKALTGGYSPLAVTLTTRTIFNAFLGESEQYKHFYHGHTFTGHSIGCAAAIANIQMYKKYGLVTKIRESSAYINQRLQEIHSSPIAKNIRLKGLLGGIDLYKARKPILKLREGTTTNSYIAKESLARGVFMRSLGNTLVIIPPLAIRKKDLKLLLDVIFNLVNKIEKFA